MIPSIYLLYIDPGTGSMLFSLAIGIITAGVFALRALILKLKFIFSGGKGVRQDQNKIPLVIYSDHKRYANVFKPVLDELEKRKISAVFYTQSADDPILNENYSFIKTEFIGEGNRAFARLNMLNAKAVLSTTPGLDVYQWKRSRNTDLYIHVPHSADDLAGYRMFGLDFYDAVLASGKNQEELIRKIESLRPRIKHKEILLTGSVPLDNLKKRLDNEKSSGQKTPSGGKTTVLLAPSWGESGILSRFGGKILTALSKTDFNVIIRPHPQSVVSEQKILKPLEEKFSHENFKNLEWNFDNDNFASLNRADVLITDFSGIILDFACVFDRPVIYTRQEFSTLPYDADYLDEPIWIHRAAQRIGIELKEENIAEIESLVNGALNSAPLQKERNAVRSECWENPGHSAQKIADYLEGKIKGKRK